MGEPLRELVVPVLEMAKQVTTVSQHCGPGTGRPDWNVVELWVNMQRNGSINAAHFHPGSFWAGVFYVDVGEVYSTKETGGELLMYDPRGCLPRMLAPYLQYSMPELHDAGTSISSAPVSVQCVRFPGWLFHAVNTYHGTAPRISVAFNLDPVLAPGMMNGAHKHSVREYRR
ncbi:MAG: hypothetical protein DYH03_05895 [Nitrospira sp. NTP1]|nr:hypothetical protein [Nitrospira sp. NTP1]